MGAFEHTVLHASCVSAMGRAALITGASGSGKSALALQLMSLGATLVSDDRTVIRREGDMLMAEAPPTIAGLVEARGIGIFRTGKVIGAPLALMVDLDTTAHTRLPELPKRRICEVPLPCLDRVEGPHFAATILLWLQGTLSPAS